MPKTDIDLWAQSTLAARKKSTTPMKAVNAWEQPPAARRSNPLASLGRTLLGGTPLDTAKGKTPIGAKILASDPAQELIRQVSASSTAVGALQKPGYLNSPEYKQAQINQKNYKNLEEQLTSELDRLEASGMSREEAGWKIQNSDLFKQLKEAEAATIESEGGEHGTGAWAKIYQEKTPVWEQVVREAPFAVAQPSILASGGGLIDDTVLQLGELAEKGIRKTGRFLAGSARGSFEFKAGKWWKEIDPDMAMEPGQNFRIDPNANKSFVEVTEDEAKQGLINEKFIKGEITQDEYMLDLLEKDYKKGKVPEALYQERKAALSQAAQPAVPTPKVVAETGKPFTGQMFRGSGRAAKESVFNPNTLQENILGEGVYSTPKKEFAAEFGPNVEAIDVSLQNPLVIKTDTEWLAWTRRAGWKSYQPVTKDDITNLRQVIEQSGFDGVVVQVPESELVGKKLQRAFGEDTVLQFQKATVPPPPVKPPTATAAAPAPGGLPDKSALTRIEKAWQAAYGEQETMRSIERARRARALEAGIASNIEDPYAAFKATPALSGPMPRAGMTGKLPQIADAEWDSLAIELDKRAVAQKLGYTGLDANRFIRKLQTHLKNPDLPLPTPSENKAFRKLFPDSTLPDLVEDLQKTGGKSPQQVTDMWGLPPTERAGMKTGVPEQLFPNEGAPGYPTPTGPRAEFGAGKQGKIDLTEEALNPQGQPLINQPGYTPGPTGGRVSSRPELEAFATETTPSTVQPVSNVWDLPPTEAGGQQIGKQLAALPDTLRARAEQEIKNRGLRTLLDIGDFLRTFRASFDVSFNFRQGLMASIRHPVAGARSFARGLQALVDPKMAAEYERFLMTDPVAIDMIRHGGYLAPLDPSKVGRTLREEAFMSRFAQQIPGIKASTRAYSTAANSLRLDVYRMGHDVLKRMGADESQYYELAKFVNLLTGRGNIPGGQKGAMWATVLNDTLFAPRLMFAKIQLPSMLWSTSPYVRMEAAKTFATFAAFTTAVMGLSAIAGGTVELDPRSAAFGKLRIGDNYIDVTGGYAQYGRLIARLATGEMKLPGGEIQEKNRLETGISFLQSKESPLLGIITDAAAGQQYGGEPFKFDMATIANYTAPLAVSSMTQAIQEVGLLGALPASLEAVGLSVTTYKSPPPKIIYGEDVPQSLQNMANVEMKDIGVGRAEPKIKNLVLTEDEGLAYQQLVAESIGAAVLKRIQEAEYLTKTPDERRKDLNLQVNRARDNALKEYIKFSQATVAHPGDSKETTQMRQDLTKVKSFLLDTQGIADDRVKAIVSKLARYDDPDLDVALILNGMAAEPMSEAAKSLLTQRKAGAIKSLKTQYNKAELPRVTKMLADYYAVEEQIWADFPPQAKLWADKISKLQSGTTEEKKEAEQLLLEHPEVVYVRNVIADRKSWVKRSNPELSYYLDTFR